LLEKRTRGRCRGVTPFWTLSSRSPSHDTKKRTPSETTIARGVNIELTLIAKINKVTFPFMRTPARTGAIIISTSRIHARIHATGIGAILSSATPTPPSLSSPSPRLSLHLPPIYIFFPSVQRAYVHVHAHSTCIDLSGSLSNGSTNERA